MVRILIPISTAQSWQNVLFCSAAAAAAAPAPAVVLGGALWPWPACYAKWQTAPPESVQCPRLVPPSSHATSGHFDHRRTESWQDVELVLLSPPV